ncbi:hypothetical protein KCP69_12590 [Salmonella enterica subsp. enterica]|nr:hypothetical protein KCP69_12590 [Salmonella enterica subsp. enterica]
MRAHRGKPPLATVRGGRRRDAPAYVDCDPLDAGTGGGLAPMKRPSATWCARRAPCPRRRQTGEFRTPDLPETAGVYPAR